MNHKRGPSYLLAFALVIAACGQREAVASSESQTTVTTPTKTRVDTSTAISTATPFDPRQEVRRAKASVLHVLGYLGWADWQTERSRRSRRRRRIFATWTSTPSDLSPSGATGSS